MKLVKSICMQNGVDLEVELNKPSKKSPVLLKLYAWSHGEEVILYRGPLGIGRSSMVEDDNPFFKAIGELLTSILAILPAFETDYKEWSVMEL